jgi:L-threonylcarbamoyladenylate synthase
LKIFPANKENIIKAGRIIKSGGLVAFPTETVYGLGANALDPIAAAKIFEAKKRPFFDPLIVHVSSISDIENIAEKFSILEQKLAEKFWPGPLTLILKKKKTVPDIVTAGLPTVAVRMPAHETARRLIMEAGCPIAAPSANLFGSISPTRAEHVLSQLGESIDMILEGGNCSVGVESTIIKCENGMPVLLRPGGLSVEEIEKVAGKSVNYKTDNLSTENNIESPGQLPYHYSPSTPLFLIKHIEQKLIDELLKNKKKAGLLAFKKPLDNLPFKKIEILSADGNMIEAAANLFSYLHNLDAAGLDIIFAEMVPENGLGKAIMDRLNKAARKSISKR